MRYKIAITLILLCCAALSLRLYRITRQSPEQTRILRALP